MQTCEFDPLRDEGSIHSAWSLFTVLEPGRRMVDEAVGWLRGRLGTG